MPVKPSIAITAMMWFTVVGMTVVHRLSVDKKEFYCLMEESEREVLGISNILMAIALIATYTISFLFERWHRNRPNLRQPSPFVYNNLSMEILPYTNEETATDPPIIKSVLSMTLLFIICWLPFFTAVSQPEEIADYTLKKYTFFLAIFKSSLNPFLLFATNPNFRHLKLRP
jgi:hypothetical protein